jgi:hypothetical protein
MELISLLIHLNKLENKWKATDHSKDTGVRGRSKCILKELVWETVNWTNLDLVKTCDGLLISVGFP